MMVEKDQIKTFECGCNKCANEVRARAAELLSTRMMYFLRDKGLFDEFIEGVYI
jgi:hypothetical protein